MRPWPCRTRAFLPTAGVLFTRPYRCATVLGITAQLSTFLLLISSVSFLQAFAFYSSPLPGDHPSACCVRDRSTRSVISHNLLPYGSTRYTKFILFELHSMNVFAISHRGIASHPFRSARFNTRPGVCCLRAEGPRVTREYREDDDTVTNAPTSKPTSDPNSVYVDELPEVRPSEHRTYGQSVNPFPQVFRILSSDYLQFSCFRYPGRRCHKR